MADAVQVGREYVLRARYGQYQPNERVIALENGATEMFARNRVDVRCQRTGETINVYVGDLA